MPGAGDTGENDGGGGLGPVTLDVERARVPGVCDIGRKARVAVTGSGGRARSAWRCPVISCCL